MGFPLFNINKKLWSFNFGCLIAGSFVWLVSVGSHAPVPEKLYLHPNFVMDYYSGIVTAISASILTIFILLVMAKAFKMCTSEYTFWLILPTLSFLAFITLAAKVMLISIIYAALPATFVILSVATYFRLTKLNKVASA